jgi:hypothetical protein
VEAEGTENSVSHIKRHFCVDIFVTTITRTQECCVLLDFASVGQTRNLPCEAEG